MADDFAFRMTLLVEFAVLLPLMAYHRLKARTGEKLDRRQEGLFILATLRPVGLVFFVAAGTYLVSPARMVWSSVPMPMWLRWSSVGLFACCWLLLFWTLHTLGTNLTDTVVTRQEHTLVTGGPYRWIRHPFYAAVTLFLTVIAMTAANWFLLVVGGLVVVLIAIRSRVEEENLLARFGEPYREYRNRTGRFLPKIASHS